MQNRFCKAFLLLPLLVTLSTHLLGQKLATTGAVSAVQPMPNGLTFRSGDALVRLTVVRPGVIRLRYTLDKVFPADHSFAVISEAQARDVKAQVSQSPSTLKFTDGDTVVTVQRSNGRIVFTDKVATYPLRSSKLSGHMARQGISRLQNDAATRAVLRSRRQVRRLRPSR